MNLREFFFPALQPWETPTPWQFCRLVVVGCVACTLFAGALYGIIEVVIFIVGRMGGA